MILKTDVALLNFVITKQLLNDFKLNDLKLNGTVYHPNINKTVA